jgi:glycosyltransferase involved in cell wall biosynthesis
MTDVSVIVPLYKGEKFIPSILRSIESNCKNAKSISIELILVNDSPDRRVNKCLDKYHSYPITLLNNSQNIGIHGSRIKGLLNSSGKYLIFLDQDDRISDNAIASQFTAIGEADAVISNGYTELPNGLLKKAFTYFHQQKRVNDLNFYLYADNRIVSPGMCMISRKAIPQIWVSNIQKINGSDDLLLWCSFLLENHHFAYNRACIYTHVLTGENTSNNQYQMVESVKETLCILNQQTPISSNLINAAQNRLQVVLFCMGKPPIAKLAIHFLRGDFKIIFYKILSRI